MKKIIIITVATALTVAGIALAAGAKCMTCNGTGWNGQFSCGTCGGDGVFGN